MKKTTAPIYDENAIVTLDGLAHIRHRAGLYLPSELDQRLHHLLWEILDNAVDEMTSGFAKKITLKLYRDGSVAVSDDGRGIPPKKLVAAFSQTNTSSKFDDQHYQNAVGTNGIGQKATNAFADRLCVQVHYGGQIHEAEFHQFGKLKQDVHIIGPTTKTGTSVRFWPDCKTFAGLDFEPQVIITRLKQLQFLVPNFHLTFHNEKTNTKDVFKNEGGLVKLLMQMVAQKAVVNEKPYMITKSENQINAEVHLQWIVNGESQNQSFVNFNATSEGGTHLNGIRYGLTAIFNKLARQWKILKDKDNDLVVKDIDEGLHIATHVKLSQKWMMFSSQTKTKLSSPEVNLWMQQLMKDYFSEVAIKQKRPLKKLITHLVEQRNQRQQVQAKLAALKQVQGNQSERQKTLSGKLAKCVSQDFIKNELFLCEGDSAGGQLITGRNKVNQAVLPLRGKIINSHKSNLKNVLANSELLTIINAIDAGIGQNCQPEQARYGKIIITTDADEDGNHIGALLLTFFWNYMQPLVQTGMIYFSLTPLFKLRHKKTNQYQYAYSNHEFNQMRKKLNLNHYEINRFKGLGELNEEQLVETALNPTTRRLIQVQVKNEVELQTILDLLMGDDPNGRKEWIQKAVDFNK